MKRLIGSIALMTLLAAPASAALGPRVETFSYEAPAQAGIEDYGVWYGPSCAGEECVGGSVNYKTSKYEKAVSVKIVDVTGTAAKGLIVQDGILKEFCGSSGRVRITPGEMISVWVSANPCGTPPEGAATTGTVTTKFFR